MEFRFRNSVGFTLVELMMVIVLSSILAIPASGLIVEHIKSLKTEKYQTPLRWLAAGEMDRTRLLSYTNLSAAQYGDYDSTGYSVDRLVTQIATNRRLVDVTASAASQGESYQLYMRRANGVYSGKQGSSKRYDSGVTRDASKLSCDMSSMWWGLFFMTNIYLQNNDTKSTVTIDRLKFIWEEPNPWPGFPDLIILILMDSNIAFFGIGWENQILNVTDFRLGPGQQTNLRLVFLSMPPFWSDTFIMTVYTEESTSTDASSATFMWTR